MGLIVARSKNNVIGKDGMIPWSIEGEQSQFKELTTNNTIIMGRKTYEDIGHPLPNRKNIVISRTTNYDDVVTVDSLEKAIELSEGNIYIIGWYNLFKEAIPMVDIMFITEVNLNIAPISFAYALASSSLTCSFSYKSDLFAAIAITNI